MFLAIFSKKKNIFLNFFQIFFSLENGIFFFFPLPFGFFLKQMLIFFISERKNEFRNANKYHI